MSSFSNCLFAFSKKNESFTFGNLELLFTKFKIATNVLSCIFLVSSLYSSNSFICFANLSNTDTNFSTSHDYKVAKILANDLIQLYLENKLIMIENKGTNEKTQRQPNMKMMWTGSKVALTELIFALHTEGAFNNGAADLKDIAEYFEHIFEIDLGQYRRTFLEIKARKNDRTKFITTLNEKLLTRMNNSDEVL